MKTEAYRNPNKAKRQTRKRRLQNAQWAALNGPVVIHSEPAPETQRFAYGNLRAAILQRDANQCQYCGVILEPVEANIDHVTPFLKGGRTVPSNLVIACANCNTLKGNALIPSELAPL